MNFGGAVHVNKTGSGVIVFFIIILLFGYRHYMSETIEITSSAAEVKVSLKRLLSAAINAAERGGDQVRIIREKADLNKQSKGKTKEGADNPVTDGDMKSHMEMFFSLQFAFPTIEVISEEHDSNIGSQIKPAITENAEVDKIIPRDEQVMVQDISVWIDPLDATQEYTENLTNYVTTMVCVALKGKAIIGVIHRPFHGKGKTIWAWSGHGYSPNLDIGPRNADAVKEPVSIIISRSHSGEVEKIVKSAFGNETKVTPAGGAGFKVLEVAEGRADAYIHTTAIKKWDLCAGDAIINAIGGKLTTRQGASIDYGEKSQAKNSDGLVATLSNHDYYLKRVR